MIEKHLSFIVCPGCHGRLELAIKEKDRDRVKEGKLSCDRCKEDYPIVRFIPRFVKGGNYASNFGFEWNKHRKTQYDRYSGVKISEERFFNETRWPRRIDGEVILEAGSGSGRFTEHAVSTGAMVVSFDYSEAVEANYGNNGHYENLLILQADIYNMPFRKNFFEKVLCIGVIQHTPFPRKSFDSLVSVLKPGGGIVFDVYLAPKWWERLYNLKYMVRPVTKRLPNEMLYRICEMWVGFWWPVTGVFYRLTGRHSLSWFLLVADYRGEFSLSDDILKEWAVLDTFDMLSPMYDLPQTIESVTRWCREANLGSVEVKHGYNGIEGRGIKQASQLPDGI